MSGTTIGSRIFSMDDQLAFARASGDFNPVHVDAGYARRSMFGSVLVHGVHSLMWALDRHVAKEGSIGSRIRAQFAKPVFLGETIDVARLDDEVGTMLTVTSEDVPLVVVSFPVARAAAPVAPSRNSIQWPSEARVLRHEDAEGREAELPFLADTSVASVMFPSLSAAVGEKACCTLMLLSRLVGMECPGRNSLFSGLAVTLERNAARDSFTYRVRRASPAFVPIQMEVAGPDLTGSVSAFFRPAEVAQPTFEEIARGVPSGEFASRKALIIGGSRGLGELTAKALAAGGAEVAVTYAAGAGDAARVRAEIEAGGGRCRIYRLDVLDAASRIEAVLSDFGPIDSAYYFATPRITGRRKAAFEPAKLAEFERYYVAAFRSVCAAIADKNPGTVTVFYPSTVFIDENNRDNVEYAQAKAKGEESGREISAGGRLRVVSKRLPRMATDQTSAIISLEVADALPVILESIRAVNAAAAAGAAA